MYLIGKSKHSSTIKKGANLYNLPVKKNARF